jgi:hypothetical protein
MGDVRVRIANLAMELFPHYGDTTQALRSLIAIANEIIEDITDLDRMMSLPVGTQDSCMHYENHAREEYDEDPF